MDTTNAMGIHDAETLARHNPGGLAAISKDVPSDVKRNDCSTCLWPCVECKHGSMYDPGKPGHCNSWMYYD